ncbi:MAG: nucleotidyltransferase domain-containing protein [Solirubrobacterales bacterium]|nr:nucleotidyltransferase domain-containing protein [Solirubrobacterales bacterium]
MEADGRYSALRKLGELGREVERRRAPEPYPRPAGPAPSLEALRLRGDEITQIAARHGARTVRVFGSVARGDAGSASDVDVL